MSYRPIKLVRMSGNAPLFRAYQTRVLTFGRHADEIGACGGNHTPIILFTEEEHNYSATQAIKDPLELSIVKRLSGSRSTRSIVKRLNGSNGAHRRNYTFIILLTGETHTILPCGQDGSVLNPIFLDDY